MGQSSGLTSLDIGLGSALVELGNQPVHKTPV
jgi:hypothetical protein